LSSSSSFVVVLVPIRTSECLYIYYFFRRLIFYQGRWSKIRNTTTVVLESIRTLVSCTYSWLTSSSTMVQVVAIVQTVTRTTYAVRNTRTNYICSAVLGSSWSSIGDGSHTLRWKHTKKENHFKNCPLSLFKVAPKYDKQVLYNRIYELKYS
jgi:hypothetical protein